ncbi:MAG: hypothetical protein HS132_05590 [Planctomycetia bacterium]|nr:hypothetical protein [Planctomycetia bacterium]
MDIIKYFIDWQTIKSYIVSFGIVKGLFVIFFFGAHAWIYLSYRGRLKDRQAEINRLAADNREYRERFLYLLDNKFGYKPSKKKGK